jgi:N-acetylneuraminate synthase
MQRLELGLNPVEGYNEMIGQQKQELKKLRARVIAEIGCNHKGEMEIAKEMIRIASVFCQVDAVKFQKRNVRELLTEEEYNAPHPNPEHSYGRTYGEHREYLEFTLEQHRELKAYCEQFNLVYSSSVWDMTSAKEIASLKPQFIKIPSAMNNHFEMLGWLFDNYEGEIHISTGMTTQEELDELVAFATGKGRNRDVVLYSCTSGYPVPFEDICLLEIKRLQEKYGDKVKEIAFSGHHLGIAVDVAAYTLGATTIERHFTLDRTWKGTDHAASLEPDGLRRLVRDLRNVERALTYKKEDILDIEKVQRKKLKYKGR